jgi:di/tricarboxylate transporter
VTADQVTVFAVLGGTLVLFAWGRWRYDVVAVLSLLAVVIAGIVPAQEAFLGFSHPAVITVAGVLILSAALRDSGVVDILADRMESLSRRPGIHVAALTGLVAICSGFMNNVGALALMMPVAITTANRNKRSPGIVLMPLAFGSILGGLVTLIGTPPNIIIASYRGDLSGSPFSMFDYTPVGIVVAVFGVIFVALIGWRLIPRRKGKAIPEHLFEIDDYITELRVSAGSPLIGKPLRYLERLGGGDVVVAALISGAKKRMAPAHGRRLRVGDLLLVQGDPTDLGPVIEGGGLELVTDGRVQEEMVRSEDVILVEAVVAPGSRLVGRRPRALRRRSGSELNLLALARRGKPVRKRLQKVILQVGDVLLLQGESDSIHPRIVSLGCLPLAQRPLKVHSKRQMLVPISIFGAVLTISVLGWLSTPVAFVAGVAALVVTNQIKIRRLYDPINLPVVVLLAAMIPVGGALETTGCTDLVADGILSLGSALPPVALLVLVMVVTMTLSDVVNNAATAVIMAPIAATIALDLGVNTDTFLMAVAIGASCAFLTPIGHQSNTLVMGPGGYRFRDYWRMGLPLEVLVLMVSTPMLLWVWPL